MMDGGEDAPVAPVGQERLGGERQGGVRATWRPHGVLVGGVVRTLRGDVGALRVRGTVAGPTNRATQHGVTAAERGTVKHAQNAPHAGQKA